MQPDFVTLKPIGTPLPQGPIATSPSPSLSSIPQSNGQPDFSTLKPVIDSIQNTESQSKQNTFEQMGANATHEVTSNWLDAYNKAKSDLGAGTVAGGFHLASDLGQALFAPLSASFNALTFGLLPKATEAIGKGVADIPGVTNVLNKVNNYFDANPDAKRVILEDFPNLLNMATLGVGGGEVSTEGLSDVAKTTSSDIKTGVGNISDIATQAKNVVTGKLENHYVGQTVDEWNKVGGDYVKTDKLLAQEEARMADPTKPVSVQDTPTFLSEHGISPKSLIGENGKFDTSEVASKLTTEAVKPFENALTEQLKVVQEGQPPVQISELKNSVSSKIDSIPNITEGDRVLMKNSANRELIALQNKYPKGITLDQLNVQKGNYWKATKFDVARPLQPQVNYNIGSVMKDVIESKSGDANVKELNGLLGNYYKAGKFLQGLDGRVPKITAAQKVGRALIKTATFGIGEKLFGISGGVGGFLLGKSISHLLENATNPVKGYVLRNLEKENPAAYKQAVSWLGQQQAQRLSRLALPAPKPLGSAENPIIPSAPTTFEAPAQSSKMTSVNPKTGTHYIKDLKTGERQIIQTKTTKK